MGEWDNMEAAQSDACRLPYDNAAGFAWLGVVTEPMKRRGRLEVESLSSSTLFIAVELADYYASRRISGRSWYRRVLHRILL